MALFSVPATLFALLQSRQVSCLEVHAESRRPRKRKKSESFPVLSNGLATGVGGRRLPSPVEVILELREPGQLNLVWAFLGWGKSKLLRIVSSDTCPLKLSLRRVCSSRDPDGSPQVCLLSWGLGLSAA